MANRLFLLCCRSCLRGERDRAYYISLGFDESKNPTSDEIKRAYKKLSLQLHPDKLAQKGVQVTPENKQDFLKLQEAYSVLSDPKRRRLYDELGVTGLKLIEKPQELSPADLLRNFRKNRGDRMSLIFLLAGLFCMILLLPVLFSLKCDGDVNRLPWVALWFPMWIVNVIMLVVAVSVCLGVKTETADDKQKKQGARGGSESAPLGNEVDDDEEDGQSISLTDKSYLFIQTVLFLLIQIFVLIRLDGDVLWSWFAVFAPWFIYEAVYIVASTKTAFIDSPTRPAPLDSGGEFGTNSDADAETADEEANEERKLKAIAASMAYFEQLLQQQQLRVGILQSFLRIWQGIFLAVQLDHSVSWNWGLVLLPSWLYLLLQVVLAYGLWQWGGEVLASVSATILADPSEMSPSEAVKLQQAQSLRSAGCMTCALAIAPLYMALVLVSRLEVSTFSTFIILLPVFLVICCCCCVVSCFLCAAANVDLDQYDDYADTAAASGAADGGGSGQAERYSEAVASAVLAQRADISEEKERETERSAPAVYGTFELPAPSHSPVHSASLSNSAPFSDHESESKSPVPTVKPVHQDDIELDVLTAESPHHLYQSGLTAQERRGKQTEIQISLVNRNLTDID